MRPASSGPTKISSASIQPWKVGSLPLLQPARRAPRPARGRCEEDASRTHAALLSPNSRSRCACMSWRTSSGSKRSNRPLHMIATRAGRDQQLRKARQRIVAELAALHRPREQRAHDRQHAPDDLAIVELGELGEARPLRQDQPDHVLAAGAVDLVHEHVDDHLGDGADRQISQRRRLDRRRRAGSASRARAPGTGSPCRGSRGRSCPWRRPRAGRHRRAGSRQSRARKTPRARRREWLRAARSGAPAARPAPVWRAGALLRASGPPSRLCRGAPEHARPQND